MVNCICWHANGEYLASVSQNLVKIWSLSSGECMQELSSDGNQFHSCVFHPSIQLSWSSEESRKRKQHSSCGPANCTGTGSTVGPSPSSPASTCTPGRKARATLIITESFSVPDDIERYGDVGSLEDNAESFLSNDGGDRRDLYVTLKQSPKQRHKDSSEGFTLAPVSSLHFSSDGKLLACAGHDRKPICCLQAYRGQNSPIMSLDFHPKKTDSFCFCDHDNEIRYWDINPFCCTRSSKGGTAQVRFQPRTGQLLAAASDKIVSIFDVETDRQTSSFQVPYIGDLTLGNEVFKNADGSIRIKSNSSEVKVSGVSSLLRLGSVGSSTCATVPVIADGKIKIGSTESVRFGETETITSSENEAVYKEDVSRHFGGFMRCFFLLQPARHSYCRGNS
ncbi:hypothetical protein DVH24_010405 [Malus domestica]|uniref:Uncharacterized protein n=1 Tax=Malus domestica TaxID=3750 RepID=A0A498JRL1_MALDO|nr:hypothetical protein DVH24_010405 [Malus domestica]